MPYIEIKTSKKLVKESKDEIVRSLKNSIKLLGKTESYLMVNIKDNESMYFKGTSEDSLIAEVKVFGDIDKVDANSFTYKLTTDLEMITKVSSERIYVNYFHTDLWGLDKENF